MVFATHLPSLGDAAHDVAQRRLLPRAAHRPLLVLRGHEPAQRPRPYRRGPRRCRRRAGQGRAGQGRAVLGRAVLGRAVPRPRPRRLAARAEHVRTALLPLERRAWLELG